MNHISVKAHANIALNKYWGKRNESLMLPTKSSLSITLDALSTQTKITFSPVDEIILNDQPAPKKTVKNIIHFLDHVRRTYSIDSCFSINSHNNFPTSAGLASSSSGYAALAYGLDKLCNLKLKPQELSVLARHGSGSACRSLFGGFVMWHKGNLENGSDSFSEQVYSKHHWPDLRMIIAVVCDQPKTISSRIGMQQTIETCPSYSKWLEQSQTTLNELILGIKKRDLNVVGECMEKDWQGMYRCMQETQPPLNYLTPTSHCIIDAVKRMRANGTQCYFTTDAGPNVKILCTQQDVEIILQTLKKLPLKLSLLKSNIGGKPETIG